MLILCIETGSTVCSVALGNSEGIVASAEIVDSRAHSAQLSLLVDRICTQAAVDLSQIDAVAVSKGPGSYTGLRIGVSFAKGVAFALGKPLIAVGSLEAMAAGALEQYRETLLAEHTLLCPMIDARRMEVYSALFNLNLDTIEPVNAVVVDSDSYRSILADSKILFFGNGAPKCKAVITETNAIFIDDFNPSARFMLPLALKAYENEQYEDLAYFEPFYLKDFVAIKAKNKVLPGS